MEQEKSIECESTIEISDSDTYKSFLALRDVLISDHKDSKIPQSLVLSSYLVLEAVDGAIGKYQVQNGIKSEEEVNQDGNIKIDNFNYKSFLSLKEELVAHRNDSKIPQSLLLSSYSVLETIDDAIDKYHELNGINNDELLLEESKGPKR